MNRQAVLTRTFVIFGIMCVVFLAGRGGGTSQPPTHQHTPPSASNPVPTITTISPNTAVAGGAAFTLAINDGQLLVNGQNFVANSVVRWNGNDRPTTFFGSGKPSAQISASDIAAVGTAAVTVFSPAPGGGNSNISTLAITAAGVSPQSISVDPNGKFAYVPNSSSNDVSMYSIDGATGTLTLIGTIGT